MTTELEKILQSDTEEQINRDIFPKKVYPENNIFHKTLHYIGVSIFVISFIAGIVFASEKDGYHTSFSLVTAITWWTSGFISGISFMAFGEIIKILHDIRGKFH
ncbi:MAG: hypothetical protein ACQEXX_07840 [Bacillota bacterium]